MEGPHNVKLVADVALFRGNDVLLTRYRNPEAYDSQPGWFLPNDLLRDGEDPEDAARRVLRDQLGISEVPVRIAFAESFTGRDRSWHLALHYTASGDDELELHVADQLAKPQWFPVEDLPPRSEVAHGGWALSTLARITGG